MNLDDEIRANGLTSLTALAWLREHNCYVRFESNQTVSVKLNGKTRRRKTLLDAVLAHVCEPPPKGCGPRAAFHELIRQESSNGAPP